MFCTHCGSHLRQNAKFCEKCGSTVSKPKAKSQRVEKSQSKIKWLVGLIALVVVGVVLSRFFLGGNSVTGYSQDETGFKKALDRHYQLLESGTEADVRQIYQDFLDPKVKVVSEEEYLKEFKQYYGNKFSKVQVHNYKVNGSEAYVDRTVFDCSDSECNKVLSKNRSFREYNYIDGKWLMNDDVWYCPRSMPYEMPPEFSRAISLVIQRSVSEELKEAYQEIMKCVDI